MSLPGASFLGLWWVYDRQMNWGNPFWVIALGAAGNLAYRLFIAPWLEPLIRFVRSKLAVLRSVRVTITTTTGGIALSGSAPVVAIKAPELPPAPAPAVPSLMQPFVSGYWSQWDAANDAKVRAAMAAKTISSSVVGGPWSAASAAHVDYDHPYNHALYGVAPLHVQQPWSAKSAYDMYNGTSESGSPWN